MSVEISRATIRDAAEMAPLMRAEDAQEVWASSRQTPFSALEFSLTASGSQAWTVRYDGKIMGMWGIVDLSLISGIALPWLLTTAEVDRHPRDFLRASRRAIRFIRERHSLAVNQIDARYTKAIRWAKRLGFEIQEPVNGFCLVILRGD